MRITSANAFETSVGSLQRRQQALTDAQTRLVSGKRVARGSDDPAAAARAERAAAQIARADAGQRGLSASRNAMQLAEGALGSAGELMQQARELLMAAGNGSYGDGDRATLAASLRGLREDLLSVANRNDGAGRYLFGGQGADLAPLADTPAGVVFQGTAGMLQGPEGRVAPLTVDGRAAWLQATDPADPSQPLSLFDAIDRVVTDLATPNRTAADVATTVREGLADFDAAGDNLSRWRSRAGDALNRIDAADGRMAQHKLDAQNEKSDAEDLDMVAAISDFQNKQSGYDAALQTYSIVQKLSLFDYLR